MDPNSKKEILLFADWDIDSSSGVNIFIQTDTFDKFIIYVSFST